MKWIKWLLAGALLSMVAACGSNLGSTPGPIDLEIAQLAAIDPDSYVGQIGTTDAFVAVVRRGNEVQAYICDGTTTKVTTAVWLEGTASGSALSASSEDGRVRLEGTLSGTGLNVTISGLNLVGAQQVVQLSAVGLGAASHPAGLWTSFGGLNKFVEKLLPLEDTYRVGWIVLSDGRQRGAALKNGGPATTQPVNPENPGIDTEGGFPVNSEPTPTNPPDPGLCAVYQGSYVGAKSRLTYEENRELRKKFKEIMRNALMLWNAECKSTYGDINNQNTTF
jgi:hypothetical protein|uniref:Lipoprotein n=1 Tax=Meiothermus ruber TaxID=277 RepID=A0A7C3HB84_MEIRU